MIDTGATGYSFVNSSIAHSICEALKISPIRLSKPKKLKTFEGKDVTSVTHTIHPTFTIQGHSESLCPMFIADIGSYEVIIGTPWMKKHGVVIDVDKEKLYFKKMHCQHSGASYREGSFNMELIENDTPLTKFFLRPHSTISSSADNDLTKKPVQYTILKPNRSDSTDKKTPIRKVGMTTLKTPTKDCPVKKGKNENEKDIRSEPIVKNDDSKETKGHKDTIDICMVGAASYNLLIKKPGAEVFAISMKDINDQLEKDNKDKDPMHIKRNLPSEYHDLIDVFSKQAADELPPHRDCDHKIELLEGHTGHGYSSLYKMSKPELEVLKKYLEDNLRKGFIKASTSAHASPVLFVRKPNGGLRFCVDYRKLNAITKRERYPMPLISDIVDKVAGAKFITVVDIRQAFNRIRVGKSSEELTTFVTSLGAYQYQVLPFGLTGGPGTWQHYINDVLFDYLIDFCMAYMDDILIYSKTIKEHRSHVRKVLIRLREAGLQVDIDKCQFHQAEVKFLGLLVGVDGVRMDPEKIKTIVDWKTPQNLKHVQAFIGFCNFYRRFIRGFSAIAKPLNKLAKKEVKFKWSKECQKAFDKLKETVIKAPVLLHFDPDKQSYIECDSSDWTTGGVFSQMGDDGQLHPVAFFSKTLNPAECNYEIYDKELLAIIRCFETWKPELEGTESPVQVLSDHKALEYFMTTKKLTRRQARWAEMLSEFNFQIVYRPGKQNDKADALTRRPDDRPTTDNDDRELRQHQIILTPNRLHPELSNTLSANCLEEQNETLEEYVNRMNKENEEGIRIRKALTDQKTELDGQRLEHFEVKDDLLFWKGKTWVPRTSQLRTKVLKHIHDQPAVGHPGIQRSIKWVQRNYQWSSLVKDVKRYVKNCHICHRAKAPRNKYQGLLKPLPIPHKPWVDIAMDFVTGLPESEGWNAILMVIDRLSKLRHYIPCRADDSGTSAEATCDMFLRYVWKHHGLPSTVTSDRGPQFVSKFWKTLCEVLNIKAKLSTAFHPETDGQSEVANQEMERYLRTYVNYQQDDWAKWLPIAEFAANANVSESTGLSPFFVNMGFEPRMSFDPINTQPTNTRDRLEMTRAKGITDKMQEVWEFTKENMKQAQAKQAEYANRHREEGPDYKIGDRVWLNTKNIKTTRPSKKLDHKNEGPFKIIRADGPSYELELPKSMRIHPVFHKNLLRLTPEDPLEGQIIEPPPPVIIEGEKEYDVVDILDARKYRGRIQFKAAWEGCDPDPTWYNAEGFEHAAEIVEDFYRRYPNKPRWRPGGRRP